VCTGIPKLQVGVVFTPLVVPMGLFNLGGYPWFKSMGPSAFVISCQCEEEG